MFDNIMKLTDSYKVSHWKQYPQGSEIVYSYLESRGGEYSHTVFFGLRYIIDRYLKQPITMQQINEAEEYWDAHFGKNIFNRTGWEYIYKVHGGHLPVEIRAVPEGTVVNTKNILMSIHNTDPKVPWLTNWLETVLMQVWYPMTVATQSKYMKGLLLNNLTETGTPETIGFKLHDFGFRGSTSVESAAIGGAAHLVNFMGTDTSPALELIAEHYSDPMAGFSIPASEHSTITSWGRDKEAEACANMLTQYPDGLVACVSDSYNIYKACEDIWGTQLRDKIMAREGTLVIRPDSGDATEVLPKILDILWTNFSGTWIRGFKTLDPHVRLIQGDGIDVRSLDTILRVLKNCGWSGDNIAFGSGGGLLQKVNRDTCKVAIKCSAIRINGVWHEVYKDPVTDIGKASKKGMMKLEQSCSGNEFVTCKRNYMDDSSGELVKVYPDNFDNASFSKIRQRANSGTITRTAQEYDDFR